MKLINKSKNIEFKKCFILLKYKDFSNLIVKLESLTPEANEIEYKDVNSSSKIIIKFKI